MKRFVGVALATILMSGQGGAQPKPPKVTPPKPAIEPPAAPSTVPKPKPVLQAPPSKPACTLHWPSTKQCRPGGYCFILGEKFLDCKDGGPQIKATDASGQVTDISAFLFSPQVLRILIPDQLAVGEYAVG